MSHFYAKVDNYKARTKCTRRGFKTSGMEATVTGWDVGCRVEIKHINDEDIIYVYKTDGSNGTNETRIFAYTQERFL